jgi:hypothetical protein
MISCDQAVTTGIPVIVANSSNSDRAFANLIPVLPIITGLFEFEILLV